MPLDGFDGSSQTLFEEPLEEDPYHWLLSIAEPIARAATSDQLGEGDTEGDWLGGGNH